MNGAPVRLIPALEVTELSLDRANQELTVVRVRTRVFVRRLPGRVHVAFDIEVVVQHYLYFVFRDARPRAAAVITFEEGHARRRQRIFGLTRRIADAVLLSRPELRWRK